MCVRRYIRSYMMYHGEGREMKINDLVWHECTIMMLLETLNASILSQSAP